MLSALILLFLSFWIHVKSHVSRPYICCCLQPVTGYICSFWFIQISALFWSICFSSLILLACPYLPFFTLLFSNVSMAFLNTFLHSTSHTAAMITKVPNRNFFFSPSEIIFQRLYLGSVIARLHVRPKYWCITLLHERNEPRPRLCVQLFVWISFRRSDVRHNVYLT